MAKWKEVPIAQQPPTDDLTETPERIWIEHHSRDGTLTEGGGEVRLEKPKNIDWACPVSEWVPAARIAALEAEIAALRGVLKTATQVLASSRFKNAEHVRAETAMRAALTKG